jgi:DNA-binding NtrC family response regulator
MSSRTENGRLLVAGGEIDRSTATAIADMVRCAWTCWAGEGAAPWTGGPSGGLVIVAAGPGAGGRAVVDALRAQRPRGVSLVLVHEAAEPALVRAAAEAADDFLSWPVRAAELDERIRRLEREATGPATPAGPGGHPGSAGTREVRGTSRRLRRQVVLRQMAGEAPAFRRMVDSLPRYASQDGTVLIVGETGTGKELCARAIHGLGQRSGGPFVAVDCGALPDQLLENELYGHARGAFTDARTDACGLVGMAEGGVLFLDEVDALSPVAQAKLLRFLQERSYRPLGGDRFIEADVRVLAATNRDLAALVEERRFRADLYFRLNVLRIEIIPLRQRPGDIPLLARHFLRRVAGDRAGGTSSPERRLSDAALQKLGRYHWPGNVRELENVLVRALVRAAPNAPEIDEGDIDLAVTAAPAAMAPPADPAPRDESFRLAKARAVAEFERVFVREMLHRHGGNITRAARAAGKDRRAFGRLVKKYLPSPTGP